MIITNLTWTHFRLPLENPFHTSRGIIWQREGIILRLNTAGGITGLGEASPHPMLEANDLPQLLPMIANLAQLIAGRKVDERLDYLDSPNCSLPPHLACGLDTAACDIAAKERGLPLSRFLNPSAEEYVAVNATIGSVSTIQAVAEAATARRAGFTSVKLKAGIESTIEAETERVAAVRVALGQRVGLRLDPNGAWTPEQAIATINALSPFNLELVEQPAPPQDLAGMAAVRRAVRVPIAADEALSGPESAERIIRAGAADVMVIKPMVVGGLRAARRIMEMAHQAGLRCLVTTTIDSGVGVAAALHLAATLPQPAMACGLATNLLLKEDLIARQFTIQQGCMHVPQGPGLGVEIDETRLHHLTIARG